MKKLKILGLLLVLSLIASCGTVSEGFKSPKKNKSDEFLVEKKSPLVMPPNFDELPSPVNKIENKAANQDSIESLINKNTGNEASIQNNTDLESSILEKINNN